MSIQKRFGCIVDCIVCGFHNRSNLSYKASEIMEHFNICSILRKNTDEHLLSVVNMKSGKKLPRNRHYKKLALVKEMYATEALSCGIAVQCRCYCNSKMCLLPK